MAQGILHLYELATAAGVSARTVRYYISRGLLPGPVAMGSKAHYGQAHLDILKRIVQAQAEGRTLDQIRQSFAGGGYSVPSSLPDSVGILLYPIAPDVGVTVRNDIDPARKRVVHQALATFARAVHVTEGEKK